ncbi:MAG: NADP-dependent phosphogluconate dehydrogenase [Flavobacteriaceae bacterium]
MKNKITWGILGLGVMGTSLSRNFARQGIELALFNRFVKGSEEQVAIQKVKKYPELKKALPFENLESFVKQIATPRKLLLMLPSGEPTDAILKALVSLLDEGDVVIDGGNSHYQKTEKRASILKRKGILFLGMGVSGGEEGALKGPSLMIGGDASAYSFVEKDLHSISAKNEMGTPCCGYLGTGGAGHFVKMVHNGIEYAEMQLIAEVFELALSDPSHSISSLKTTLDTWQKTDSQNYLLGITASILGYYEKGVPFIDWIEDQASNKGTGAWATASATQIGSPNTLMSAALHARFTSFFKKERIKWSGYFNRKEDSSSVSLDDLKKAYDLSRWINHHQGFEMIRHGSEMYRWEINSSRIASIWSNGCIIKSKLMDRLIDDLNQSPTLFDIPRIRSLIKKDIESLKGMSILGIKKQIPTPMLSTSLNYFYAMTQDQSNANLIQAQRDFFGRHGFRTTDSKSDGLEHGPWANL